ncbi:ubiquitin-conjugating enzyme subfamily protein [Toxoplasma gondii GAB2-2007-GAL-DOM2]|uniref:Ubiquitin-conjugating enzyme subfamily protein n=6 Tax=Toxoplasma gondii TaxID=5811 RepID=S7WG05_TOXGG|nr:ubiquitin-conjugating enzyme subfamily protein [Toxoplasma gondii GT1]KAF4638840.1 ubiquitin-conjugating enzyme subfamily protein [Toxoplasma gondii]KFG40877.1 ubiquitin-conjugating enzyme subfamily protein [Toxoplasma gondii GAB2-2007-GAL-DOM2]RQX70469.1 ubiquitin-conjugating enzyme subfamily protein [Toxoplasma gondii CAST]
MSRDKGGGRGAFLGPGRLAREFSLLQRQGGVPHAQLQPDMNDTLTWHFVLHDLPADSPYHGGVYHGKLVFPPNYPFAPPSIFMLTPSGRFEVNKRICMSMSDFHPESWNPSWRLETLVTAFLSFMLDAGDAATHGSVSMSFAQRRRLALQSFSENKRHKNFAAMFPDFVDDSKYDPARGFSLSGVSPAAGKSEAASKRNAIAGEPQGSQRGPPTQEPGAMHRESERAAERGEGGRKGGWCRERSLATTLLLVLIVGTSVAALLWRFRAFLQHDDR